MNQIQCCVVCFRQVKSEFLHQQSLMYIFDIIMRCSGGIFCGLTGLPRSISSICELILNLDSALIGDVGDVKQILF